MCNAYSEIVFFLIYRKCSRCLISNDFPVWPTYDLLHALLCNLYIQLEFILFCGDVSHSWLYLVLHVRNAMFKSVRLNRMVILCMSGLLYVNVIHFFLCVCAGVFYVFCVLIVLFLKLWMIWNGKPLFLAMVQIGSHSCCLICSVTGVDSILFT